MTSTIGAIIIEIPIVLAVPQKSPLMINITKATAPNPIQRRSFISLFRISNVEAIISIQRAITILIVFGSRFTTVISN
jgi:hypothetical protein